MIGKLAAATMGACRRPRRLRNGEPSTRLERYSLDRDTGELVPTPRQGLTIRDDALPDVLAALQRIWKVARQAPKTTPAQPRPRRRQAKPRTGDLTTEDRSKDVF